MAKSIRTTEYGTPPASMAAVLFLDVHFTVSDTPEFTMHTESYIEWLYEYAYSKDCIKTFCRMI